MVKSGNSRRLVTLVVLNLYFKNYLIYNFKRKTSEQSFRSVLLKMEN